MNEHTELLNTRVRESLALPHDIAIEWKSPLAGDQYAEYRDDDFLELLGVKKLEHPLSHFWPVRGPQWDALATVGRDGLLIVEAKANVPEAVSPGTGAKGKRLKDIERSLAQTKQFLGVPAEVPWSGKLYQYANRHAHLYFLRTLNKKKAYLAFVYFTRADDVDGPKTVAEWAAAMTVVKGVLGLSKRHRLSRFVGDVYIDVPEMINAA
ncbi:MAG: hypothetical protein ACREYF_25595 [Gammaproteobacteria bacterium]